MPHMHVVPATMLSALDALLEMCMAVHGMGEPTLNTQQNGQTSPPQVVAGAYRGLERASFAASKAATLV